LLHGLLEIETTDKSVAQVIRDTGNYERAEKLQTKIQLRVNGPKEKQQLSKR
jgi:hypothetical protein